MEKRRYRPGYHIEVKGKQTDRRSAYLDNQRQPLLRTEINKSPLHTVSMTNPDTLQPSAKLQPVLVNKPVKNSPVDISKTEKKKGSIITRFSFKKTNHLFPANDPEDIKVDNKKRRRGWGWGLGAVSFGFFIGAIMMFVLMSGYYGFNIYLGIAMMLMALIFMMIALIVRFKKYNNLLERNDDPQMASRHSNAVFIMGIISAALALIAFILSFIVSPAGVISFSISIPALIAGLIGTIIGLTNLKSDKGLKNKLGIILGALAVILTILAIIIIFL